MSARRPKSFPMFMGLPSPSLARIERMSRGRLATHIASLQRESLHILSKLDRLKTMNPPPTEKMDAMIVLLARLRALEKFARNKYPPSKEERVRAFLDGLSGPPKNK